MVTDMSDLSFTGEITSASLDSSMSFERREMMPKRLAKAIKVSKELESISAADFAAFIIGRGTYKAAAVEENSFLNGSGVGEPLGLFTVSENGCSASRNVTTGNTSTDLKADNLIETYHSLKSQYLQSSTLRWLFSRETLKKIRKMKDGEGNFLWSQGFGANPATVLGVPYVVSEYAPDTYTSGARVAALADLKFYGIAQRQADISVKVLDQLYALENCNAYLFQTWVDGMPLVEEAFSFCTLG
jgi:HK97 family phage major capsid protein